MQIWLAWQRQQHSAEHVQQVVLMQRDHLIDFCTFWLKSDSSNLGVMRLQHFVVSVSRVTLQQRMQLVVAGYRTRFARIGVITSGMILFLRIQCIFS